jgi:iron complex outermembrane receptor protein
MRLIIIALMLIAPSFLQAQAESAEEHPQTFSEPEEEEIIELEGVEAVGKRETSNVITQEEMERTGAEDLWEAVKTVPGVIMTGGGQRNDANFLIRGFGADSVPVFVDGIDLSLPYRGEGDAARLLTGDLEEIEISKGYSSSLLGANTLGGAVQVRTARPKKPLELSAKTGLDLDGAFGFAGVTQTASAGTKLDWFYGKASFQVRRIDHYRLPDSFTPYDDADPAYGGSPQKAGNRLWSDSTDYKLTLLAGAVPLPGLDVSLTYIMQIADKGFSPPAAWGGRDSYVIWNWPRWDRHNIAASYSYDWGNFFLKGFTYFGKYDNRLDQYYNWRAYMRDMHLPHSDYDEYAVGSHLEGGYAINEAHTIQAAITYKQNDHRGIDGERETVHINEDTWSAGAEYSAKPFTQRFLKPLAFSAGVGFDLLYPRDFSSVLNDEMIALGTAYYIVKSEPKALISGQLGLFYDITSSHEAHFTYARKNRFPTMFQRYSTRFGDVLPNSRLGAEFANHFEIGWKGSLFEMLNINAAVYYSEITGKIVNILIANPLEPSASVEYAINLDKTGTYGFELGFTVYPFSFLSGGGAFALNKYAIWNSQMGAEKLTYYPEITFNCYAEIKPLAWLSLIPSLSYTGERFVNVEGTEKLSGYVLCDIKAVFQILGYGTISIGVENLFDQLYEIRQHYPLEGRTFNLTLGIQYPKKDF